MGGRYNYKLNSSAVIYGDLGLAQFDSGPDSEGLSFGAGGYYQIDGIFLAVDLAVYASLHLFDLDIDNSSRSLEGNSLVVEALFSGKEAINAAGSLFYNGSIGLTRFDSEISDGGPDDTDTELTISGGLVLQTPNIPGQFYGGLLYVDDLLFGAGYRYFLK